jgi:hypothetical protein
VDEVYAVITTGRLDQSKECYTRLFGRAPDLHPTAEVARGALVASTDARPSSGGDFARIAQITDLDGNQVTLAQPGPGQRT